MRRWLVLLLLANRFLLFFVLHTGNQHGKQHTTSRMSCLSCDRFRALPCCCVWVCVCVWIIIARGYCVASLSLYPPTILQLPLDWLKIPNRINATAALQPRFSPCQHHPLILIFYSSCQDELSTCTNMKATERTGESKSQTAKNA